MRIVVMVKSVKQFYRLFRRLTFIHINPIRFLTLCHEGVIKEHRQQKLLMFFKIGWMNDCYHSKI